MRYFIYFKYDGSAYHGLQIQPNANSIQEELQKAMSTILQRKTDIVAAGRTDTGVHAEEMVAHFDTEHELDTNTFVFNLNNLLPFDISIYRIVEVNKSAHARFDAQKRSYQYKLNTVKNPFLHKRSFYLKKQLDITKMNEAAKLLIGEFDFSCFSKSNTQTYTNLCIISTAYWEQNNSVVTFHVSANRFLRNMVRAIVGTLIEVGEGKRTIASISELINKKERTLAGASAPACGLYLTEVVYPKSCFEVS